MKIRLCCIFLFLTIGCEKFNNDHKLTLDTVEYVDIEKFMGDWYVIANIPTYIDRGAVNAIESYRLNEKGEIETNFSFNKNSLHGKRKKYDLIGNILNLETNAEWNMVIFGVFKVPFLIIDLADDYSYTVIGYPNRKYVWIMGREPEIGKGLYDEIINNLDQVGYDISMIQKVPQLW